MKKLGTLIASFRAALCFALGYVFRYRFAAAGMIAWLFFGFAFLFCVLALLSIIDRKNKKVAVIIRRVLLGIFAVGLIYFVAVEAVLVIGSRTDSSDGADYLIVLGAGVDGTRPSPILHDRLSAALEYLKKYPEAKAVVSGGQGRFEEITEAECMYVWLTESGISRDRVIKEERALNTKQNIDYSLSLIRSDSVKTEPSVAVLTSEFHLFRAREIARNRGVKNPLGVSAKTTLQVPKLNYYIREAFAVTAMWVFGA